MPEAMAATLRANAIDPAITRAAGDYHLLKPGFSQESLAKTLEGTR